MIRVLTVTQRLSEAGGIPVVIRSLLRHSDPARIRHYVCQLRPVSGEEADDSMPSLDGIFSLELRGRWIRSARAIPAAFRLLRLIRSLRPDVVHLHTGTALIAAPSKLILRGSYGWLLDLHEPMPARHSAITSAVVASMVRRKAWCVTHSPPVRDEIARTLRIPDGRLLTIPLGIDIGRFESPEMSRAEWRAEFGFSDDAIVVLTVGKVSDMKGIHRVLEVAEMLRSRGSVEITFALIGLVGDADAVSSAIRTRGVQDSVRLLGFVDDLPSALHAADIYFAPSSYEGFGLSVVEAMATGLPVVASAVGGLTYVVEHGRTGYTVDADDMAGFCRAIERLSADQQRRQELGRSARTRVRENFDVEGMAARYGEVYRQIAER